MSETIVNIQTVPEVLFRIFNASMVKIREEKEGVMVIPVKERAESPLRGMLAEKSKSLENGELHSERFSREKQLEKELEF